MECQFCGKGLQCSECGDPEEILIPVIDWGQKKVSVIFCGTNEVENRAAEGRKFAKFCFNNVAFSFMKGFFEEQDKLNMGRQNKNED